MTTVSVIIPTYNRWERLATVLDALARQSIPSSDLEIVVVSDGSSDGTDEHLRAGDTPLPVTAVSQPNQGPAAARNRGVAEASGDLVLFIDDDVVAEPGCVAADVAAHASAPSPTVVIGPMLTPEEGTLAPWVNWEQQMLEKQYDAMARGDWTPTPRQFYTGNASLDRARFLEAGGFDTSFRRAEDVELAYRLHDQGMHFVFSFEARAHHHADRSYASWLSNATAYGTNDVIFWRDGGQDWLVPTLRAEYQRRHVLTRVFTRLGLEVPAVGELFNRVAPAWSSGWSRLGFGGGGRRVLSAVYNLHYYRGLVDELGGIDQFLAIEPVAWVGGSN